MATSNPYTSAAAPSPLSGLSLIAPDLTLQQTQLARQQQMADLLKQQALTPFGDTQQIGGWAVKRSPLEGLGKLVQAYSASTSQDNIDTKQAALATALQSRLGGLFGGGAAATTPVAPSQPDNSIPDAALAQGAQQQPSAQMADGTMTNMGGVGPTNDNAQRLALALQNAPAAQPTQAQQAQQPSSSGALQIPGMSPQQAQLLYALNPDAYLKAKIDQYGATDATKMANAAGIDVGQANKDALFKNNYIAPVNARPGSILRDPKTNLPMAFNPQVPEGASPTFDASGNVVGMTPIKGAYEAMFNSKAATAGGTASQKPIAGVDAQGNPVFTNEFQAAGGALPGAAAQAPTQSGPVATGSFPGYTPASQPQGSMTNGKGPVAPSLSPGAKVGSEGIATANAKRATDLINNASDSPTRVNVLDNILSLSTGGVESGTGQEYYNSLKGALVNTPLLRDALPNGWKDDVTGSNELYKFLGQNATRAWQAAGGTGTDSQLENIQKTSPNIAMTPKALQSMAQWAKAGEVALQTKAAAQDQWLASHQNNPVAQNQFESQWRANFDPRIYQMKLMSPDELQTFVAKMPASDKAALMKKYSTVKQNGWLQ